MVLSPTLSGLYLHRWRETAARLEVPHVLGVSTGVRLRQAPICVCPGLRGQLGLKSTAWRKLAVLRKAGAAMARTHDERMCYWETNETHENKGTTAAGQARLEFPCLQARRHRFRHRHTQTQKPDMEEIKPKKKQKRKKQTAQKQSKVRKPLWPQTSHTFRVDLIWEARGVLCNSC